MFNRKLKARIAELSMKAAFLERAVAVRDKDNERLKDKLTESERRYRALAESEVVYGKRMVNLKFKALFNGFYQDTEFKTGLGKCGKTVTHLEVTQDERLLTIYQYHTDGSHKEFVYRVSDIDGRIQKCFENVKLEGLEAKREKANRLLERARRNIYIPC